MRSARWALPFLCVAGTLAAQSSSDLNGLVTAANHYVSSGMSSAHDPETLTLSKITGDSGSPFSGILMSSATDVQHWTFLYKVAAGQPAPPAEDSADALPHHPAVLAECTKGVFGDFHYSNKAVTGVKSLEYTWVAVPLDAAIASLNAYGFVRGFQSVDLMRPSLPDFPDDYVYVFNCPWERRQVAISCQNGSLVWTIGY